MRFSPKKRQVLFCNPVPFQEHRIALVVFFLLFLSVWLSVYFKVAPSQATYELVFGPVIIVGYWWFYQICKKFYRDFGPVNVWKLIGAFWGMWLLANIVDISLIVLGAWGFNQLTNLGSFTLTWPFSQDVFGNEIEIPWVEIFGFNGCISWFIHFCQIFINELIKDSMSWKKLFDWKSWGYLERTAPASHNALLRRYGINPQLTTAVVSRNKIVADGLLENLIDRVINGTLHLTRQACRELLFLLRKNRLFVQMERAYDAFDRSGVNYPGIHVQMAQALVDQGKICQANCYLGKLNIESFEDTFVWTEVKGLLGRMHKWAYLNGFSAGQRREEDLINAMESYREAYLADGNNLWHGINYVACMARGQRDGLKSKKFKADWKKTADSILKSATDRIDGRYEDPGCLWDLAVCLEACIAVDKMNEAKSWVKHYTRSSSADAFEFAGTYRQLQQVWGLGIVSPYAEILDLLGTALLNRRGGSLTFTPSDISGAKAITYSENSPEDKGPDSGCRLADGLSLVKCMARVESPNGYPVGTGFLVSGSDIRRDWQGRIVFVTAAHVVGGTFPGALSVSDASLNFTSENKKCRAEKLLWISDELDLAILSLKDSAKTAGKENCTPPECIGISDILKPDSHSKSLIEMQSPLFIIGQPFGKELNFTATNNLFAGASQTWLRYASDDTPGSSGCPVFNSSWKAVGVHLGAYAGNSAKQGTHFGAIIREASNGNVLSRA